MANLNTLILSECPVILPPLPEQKAIAHILGTLDDKIELNRQMNETLEAMARAIFKDWFVDFGPTRAKMSGRAAYLPEELWSLLPEAIDEETGLPQGWEERTIVDSCARIVNGGTPKRDNNEYWDNGDIPWLTSAEVRQKVIIETDNFITQKGLIESSAKIIDSGSTVVALYGATAGQVSYLATEVSTNQAICALTPKKGYSIYNYLHLSSNTDNLASMARGSALPLTW
jgi:type I restriction enzyme S subunit